MKQLVVLLLVLLIGLNGCFADREMSDNPFRMESAVIAVNDGETITVQYLYHDQGYIQQEIQQINGEHNYTIYFEYDAWGNTIRETTCFADGTQLNVEHFLTLDDAHRTIYSENYSNTELTDCVEITYDKKGNQVALSSTIVRNGKDEIIDSQMTYDKQGNLIKKEVCWSNDPSKGGTTTYCYDKGHLTREEYYAPSGWLKSYIEYSYDEAEHIQTAMEYNSNGTLQSKTVIRSDEYGNVLHYAYYSHTGKIPGSGDDIADRIATYTYEPIAQTADGHDK